MLALRLICGEISQLHEMSGAPLSRPTALSLAVTTWSVDRNSGRADPALFAGLEQGWLISMIALYLGLWLVERGASFRKVQS